MSNIYTYLMPPVSQGFVAIRLFDQCYQEKSSFPLFVLRPPKKQNKTHARNKQQRWHDRPTEVKLHHIKLQMHKQCADHQPRAKSPPPHTNCHARHTRPCTAQDQSLRLAPLSKRAPPRWYVVAHLGVTSSSLLSWKPLRTKYQRSLCAITFSKQKRVCSQFLLNPQNKQEMPN